MAGGKGCSGYSSSSSGYSKPNTTIADNKLKQIATILFGKNTTIDYTSKTPKEFLTGKEK